MKTIDNPFATVSQATVPPTASNPVSQAEKKPQLFSIIDKYDYEHMDLFSPVDKECIKRAISILDKDNIISHDYMKKEDFICNAPYFDEIDAYRGLNNNDYPLQVLCDFAQASVTLAYIGYQSEEYIVMTRSCIEDHIDKGMVPVELYVKTKYYPTVMNGAKREIALPNTQNPFILKENDYHRAEGLNTYFARIEAERATNPDNFILQQFCDYSEAALTLADLGYNYPRYLMLDINSIAYLVNEALRNFDLF